MVMLLVAAAGDVIGEDPASHGVEVETGEHRDHGQALHGHRQIRPDHRGEPVGLALDRQQRPLDLLVVLELDLEQLHHLDGKANRLASMIRANLAMAMQGLSVVPMFAGFDLDAMAGRIFSYDVPGGCYDEHDHHSVGSGSLFARGAMKKLWRPGMDPATATRVAVEALYDAADDDSATGGPDLGRRIWPTLAVVDAGGLRFLDDDALAGVVELIVADRRGNPGGAR